MSDSADAATCICGAFPGLVCGSQCKSRPGIRAIPTSGGMGRAVLESFVLGAMMSAEHCQTDESAGQCAAATVQQILSALSAVPGRIDLEEAAADPHADRGAGPSGLDADWFDQIEDLLDDYSDAEIIDGTTHPNKAMRLLCELREAMGR